MIQVEPGRHEAPSLWIYFAIEGDDQCCALVHMELAELPDDEEAEG